MCEFHCLYTKLWYKTTCRAASFLRTTEYRGTRTELITVRSSMQGVTSDPLCGLITSTPDISTNPVGSVARKALVSKVKKATPGRHTEPFGATGKLFKDIFFPNYSPAAYEEDVVSVTSLDDNWWSNVSVAVLCQSMYYQTSDLRPQLLIDKINSSMDAFNATLNGKAVKWYTHVLLKDYIKYSGDFQQAKSSYIHQICTTTWVTYKMKQYKDGTWLNPSWEEFHHWIKLSALGASVDEISQVIQDLKRLGLRIFPDVDIDKWQQYLVWYNPNFIGHDDVDNDARAGEQKEVYLPSMGGFGCFMKEENSYEFTAISQPGEQYRSLPSSSCFSSRTKVLMADGVITEIQHIKIGDIVASPHGPRNVMLVSSPKRSGRALYSINNHSDFWFTSTHPFINASCNPLSMQPYYLAISPLQLAYAVPTLGNKGIGRLEVGSHLAHFKGEVKVISIETQQADGDNEDKELLYDLILEPDDMGEFEYFVGDKDMQFLVASELPSLSIATTTEKMACSIILDAIYGSLQSLETMHSSMSSRQFNYKLNLITNQMSAGLLCYATQNSTPLISTKEFKHADLNFVQHLKEAAAMFVLPDGKYNPAAGEAFAHLSVCKFFYQISSVLDLGFKSLSLLQTPIQDWMAVSILSIHTHSTSITDMYAEPEIAVSLSQCCPIKHALVVGDKSSFLLHVNKVCYIFCGNQTNNEFVLNIDIHGGCVGQEAKTFHASTHLVLPFHHGYRHFCIPIFCGKDEVGFLVMDVRMLSGVEIEEEKKRTSGWEQSNILPLAQNLSEYANKKLSALLCTNGAISL